LVPAVTVAICRVYPGTSVLLASCKSKLMKPVWLKPPEKVAESDTITLPAAAVVGV
jgi:hypothetical protein